MSNLLVLGWLAKLSRSSRLLVGCGLLCLLGACSLLPVAGASRSVTGVVKPLAPLDYYVWVQIAQAQELEAERERLLHLEEDGVSDPVVIAVQLALLAVSSGAADQDQALARLDKVYRQPAAAGDRDYRIFAELLRSQLRVQAVLRDTRQQLGSKTRELAQVNENNRQLQDKINALTTIEQQLIQREQRGETRP